MNSTEDTVTTPVSELRPGDQIDIGYLFEVTHVRIIKNGKRCVIVLRDPMRHTGQRVWETDLKTLVQVAGNL